MADEASGVLKEVQDSLQKKDSSQLRSVISSLDGPGLEAFSWEIIGILAPEFTDELAKENETFFQACETSLLELADRGPAKELLLAFLEQADCFKDDSKFKVLLEAVRKVLLRLPTKRQYSLEMALTTLMAHFESIPEPEDMKLEPHELVALESDESVIRIADVGEALADFLEVFVDEVKSEQDDEKRASLKKLLTASLLKMLEKKLLYVNVEVLGDKGAEPCCRAVAVKVMKLFAGLYPSFVPLLKERTEKDSSGVTDEHGEDEMFDRATSTFLYFAFGQQLERDGLLYVYCPEFRFEFAVPFIAQLLSVTNHLIISKGLQLLTVAMNDVEAFHLSGYLMDYWAFTAMIKNLLRVGVQAEVEGIRHTASKLIPKIVERLDFDGRYKLIQYLLKSKLHSSINGYAVQMLKDQIILSLDTSGNSQFSAGSLSVLWPIVFALPDGAKTDILDDHSRIMSALNLMRFLCVRDKRSENRTGFWNYIPKFKNSFLEPLRKGVEITRAHYQLELKQQKEGGGGVASNQNLSVGLLGGAKLPAMSGEQRCQTLESGLTSLDLISFSLTDAFSAVERS